MSIVVPLEDWYPNLYRRWLKSDRRYTVPVGSRTGYTVHHTAGGDGQAPLRYARGVGDWHFSKWSRPGGYNFLIGGDGTVFEMCGWGFVGAHAPGCNRTTIGVAFQGTFDTGLPNGRQLAAFAQLVNEGRVPARQQGHRDCSDTTCPGSRLYRALPLNVEEDDMPAPKDWDDADIDRVQAILNNTVVKGTDKNFAWYLRNNYRAAVAAGAAGGASAAAIASELIRQLG